MAKKNVDEEVAVQPNLWDLTQKMRVRGGQGVSDAAPQTDSESARSHATAWELPGPRRHELTDFFHHQTPVNERKMNIRALKA